MNTTNKIEEKIIKRKKLNHHNLFFINKKVNFKNILRKKEIGKVTYDWYYY